MSSFEGVVISGFKICVEYDISVCINIFEIFLLETFFFNVSIAGNKKRKNKDSAKCKYRSAKQGFFAAVELSNLDFFLFLCAYLLKHY